MFYYRNGIGFQCLLFIFMAMMSSPSISSLPCVCICMCGVQVAVGCEGVSQDATGCVYRGDGQLGKMVAAASVEAWLLGDWLTTAAAVISPGEVM